MGDSRKRQVRRRAGDYYYHNESIPLYALDIYAKDQKANLSAAEKRAARKTVAHQSGTQQEEIAVMAKESKPKTRKRTPKSTAAGRSL